MKFCAFLFSCNRGGLHLLLNRELGAMKHFSLSPIGLRNKLKEPRRGHETFSYPYKKQSGQVSRVKNGQPHTKHHYPRLEARLFFEKIRFSLIWISCVWVCAGIWFDSFIGRLASFACFVLIYDFKPILNIYNTPISPCNQYPNVIYSVIFHRNAI